MLQLLFLICLFLSKLLSDMLVSLSLSISLLVCELYYAWVGEEFSVDKVDNGVTIWQNMPKFCFEIGWVDLGRNAKLWQFS